MPNSSYAITNDMYHLTAKKVADENNERILRNSLLFPISKAFLEMHPQYDDVIRNFEAAVSKIPQMLEFDKDSCLNTYITINENKRMHLKVNVRNVRLYSPDDAEAFQLNGVNNMETPKIAIAKHGTYSLTLVGDLHYEYLIINMKQMQNMKNKKKYIKY